MGGIKPAHGRASIETRGNFGFIIHMDYGCAPQKEKVRHLSPGAEVQFEGERYKLRALYETSAELGRVDVGSPLRKVDLDTVVELPDTEDFYPDAHPLAKPWNGADSKGHPEFAREDLDDLIEALEEAKAHFEGRL